MRKEDMKEKAQTTEREKLMAHSAGISIPAYLEVQKRICDKSNDKEKTLGHGSAP